LSILSIIARYIQKAAGWVIPLPPPRQTYKQTKHRATDPATYYA